LLDAMPSTSLGGISGENTVGFILARDGSVSFASPSMERVMGRDAEWKTGADIFDTIIQFVHPDDQYETMRLIHYLLVTPGGIDEIAFRLRLVDGDWHDMRLHGANLIDHPAIEGVILVAGTLLPP
jgi:PAS domain-containing protein